MTTHDMSGVVPLSQLSDFQVAEGYPDARGYSVLSSEGQLVGTVRELHADPMALRVRFLEVEQRSVREGGAGNRVLVRVEDVRIQGRERLVHLEGVTTSMMASLPPYMGMPFPSRGAERGNVGAEGHPPTAQRDREVRRAVEVDEIPRPDHPRG